MTVDHKYMDKGVDVPVDNQAFKLKLPSSRLVIVMVLLFMTIVVSTCIWLTRLYYTEHLDLANRNLSNLLVLQKQFHNHFFEDLNGLVQFINTSYQPSGEINPDTITIHYDAVVRENPAVIQPLLVMDVDGRVIYDSQPDTPLLDSDLSQQTYYVAHTQESRSGFIVSPPLESDTGWSITLSQAIRDADDNLLGVVAMSLSSELWSQSMSGVEALQSYSGMIALDDGTILTGAPYSTSRIASRIPSTTLDSLRSSTTLQPLPSVIASDTVFMKSDTLALLPVNLLVTVPVMEALTSYNELSALTALLSFVTLLTGGATILLYMRQIGLLQFQTQNIQNVNLQLSDEVQARQHTEMALRNSEERYRVVTEMISDYAFASDVQDDGTRVREWMTDSFYRTTGYTREDIGAQSNVQEFTHPDDRERVRNAVQRTLQGEETITEYRWKIKSGEYAWFRVKRKPIWDEDHKRVIRVVGAVSNITAEKEAEIALRESEERYRLVTELISDYAFSLYVQDDGTMIREWVTDSFFTMTGYTQEDLTLEPDVIGRTHPDDLDFVYSEIDRTLTGIETSSEYRWKVKSGDYIWVRVNRKPIWNDDQTRVIRLVMAVSDISLEKEAEFARQRTEERYRKISELISDVAYESTIDIDGTTHNIWSVGPLNEITGQSDDDVQHVDHVGSNAHPDDYDRVRADVARTLERNEVTMTEYRVLVQGQIRWIRVKREPVWDHDEGRVVSVIAVLNDITAEKEAEMALRESEYRYRKISESLSDFAYEKQVNPDGTLQTIWTVGAMPVVDQFQDSIASTIAYMSQTSHLDDRDRVIADFRRTLNNEIVTTEFRVLVDDEYRWMRVTRRPRWNPTEERVIRIIGSVKDIQAEKEAEAAYNIIQQRYREISEMMSDYAFSVTLGDNEQDKFDWLVGSVEDILGLDMSEIITPYELASQTHPDDSKRLQTDLNRTRDGYRTSTEYRIIHRITNEIRWLRVIRQPVWDDEHQKVIRIIGATTDITAQKEAEIALSQNEERYRMLTELMSDYVFAIRVNDDDSLAVDWFFGSFEKITGLSVDQFTIANKEDMIQIADDKPNALTDIDRTLQGEATISEYQIINARDHKPRWIRVSRYPIWNDDQTRVVRILGATQDITYQKQAERAVRDSEERYRLLTEIMTDYAFSVRVDEDGSLYREWLVGGFEEISGYSVKPEGYFYRPEEADGISDNLKMMMQDVTETINGRHSVSEYRIINQKDNLPRWIRVNRYPIWNDDHTRVIRFLGAVKNITLEKEAEAITREADELRRDLEREKELHELRSRFVSMVTHEFRNPLAAIQISVSILEKYHERLTLDKRQEKYANIYFQIQRLTDLLEDLLGVGELESQAYHLHPQRVNMIEVIQDLLREYRETIGRQHHLELITVHQRINTFVDNKLMTRALGNIISNAIKYSPAGSTVTCKVKLHDKHIEIQIVDEGMGIPEQDFDQLFQAFYRASNVGAKPGTGLGLVIAQQAIELHNGTINFESQLGYGTTFTIVIPQVIGGDEIN